MEHVCSRLRPNLNPMISHFRNWHGILSRPANVRVLNQRHVAFDAQPIDGGTGEFALLTVVGLVAFEAVIHQKVLLATTLIPMRIMACEASHFRLAKARTFFESSQLARRVRIGD